MPEDFLSLSDACSHFPTKPSRNTVVRWATKGLYGAKLQTIRFAGKRLTRKVWVAEFSAAMLKNSPTYARDDAPVTAAAEDAASKLDALGIK